MQERNDASSEMPRAGGRKTVGVVVIGDEVLSRKVDDANTPTILDAMVRHGIDVGEVAMIRDELPRIARVVADFARRFDFVLTTGGVGPTHDDCTWAAVGAAFDTPVELHAGMWARMQERMPEGVSDEQKRMAMLPRGVMIEAQGGAYLFSLNNVFVMPGIPAMVRRTTEVIATRYSSELRPLATVYFTRDEWDSVAEVDRLVAAFSDLAIGSYPVLDGEDHRHRVTVEGEDPRAVQRAVAALIEDIGAPLHVRTHWRPETE